MESFLLRASRHRHIPGEEQATKLEIKKFKVHSVDLRFRPDIAATSINIQENGSWLQSVLFLLWGYIESGDVKT